MHGIKQSIIVNDRSVEGGGEAMERKEQINSTIMENAQNMS
jgi:hypothetical protein